MRRPPPSGAGPVVEVLRVGHRPGRDPRLTTHLALTARALGASRLWLHPPDPGLSERLRQVARRWGGSFTVDPSPDWKRTIRDFDGTVVHLTMYGRPVGRSVASLRRARKLLVVVGGAKVPPALYGLADRNVAVGNQPHSEVGALAVLLAALGGPDGPRSWPGAEARIVPSVRGKRVVPARSARGEP